MGVEESKRVLTEVIRRQMAILGPDITLAKVKNVAGIEVDAAGAVINVTGDTQTVLQNLINQFVELSGLIVKKTMESIIMSSATGAQIAAKQMVNSAVPQVAPAVPQQAAPVDYQPQSQAPAGYSIGVPQAAPQLPQEQVQQDKDNLESANKDIEDLNKMLNNLTVTQPSSAN